MKPIQSILGCALVAGLMTVASSNVQAAGGIVFDNELYTPLTISVTATFDIGGKNKKEKITNTQIIEALSLPSTTDLVWDLSSGDVWSMDSTTSTLEEDLSAEGFLTINNGIGVSTSRGSTTTYTGSVGVEIYSNPVFDSTVLDPAESEAASSNWIELSGEYKGSITSGAVKKGLQKISTTYSAKNLNGNIHAAEFSATTESATGDVSTSGSGSLVP
jgi:hypothetical protein